MSLSCLWSVNSTRACRKLLAVAESTSASVKGDDHNVIVSLIYKRERIRLLLRDE